MEAEPSRTPIVYTVGHSSRSLGEFIQLLETYHISEVVDVRKIPRSRHNPQFSGETLHEALKAAGIKYLHVPGLGGLRHPSPDSVNTGWRNRSFRGYADYMQTPEFSENVEHIAELAKHERIALMCAEAVPWRCHRSLIADALVARGIEVKEIISKTNSRIHVLTPWAKVDGQRITYPAVRAGENPS